MSSKIRINNRKITDVISLPSEALQAMVDGLEKQSKRRKFKIDMSSFGEYSNWNKTCYGCAATCTLQELAGKNLPGKAIGTATFRSMFLKFDRDDMSKFEDVIDSTRRGSIHRLFDYFDKEIPWNLKYPTFILRTEGWQEELSKVKEYITYLKKRGF